MAIPDYQRLMEPDIQAFADALDMGSFITSNVDKYVQRIDKKTLLIDVHKLTDLMIKHNLGVSVKETYKIKTIDIDFLAKTQND